MAWIFLAVSEELASPSINGSAPSFTVKESDSQLVFFSRECNPESWTEPQYGPTLPRSGETCCPTSTLSTAVSPAKTSLLPVLESAWKESEADYFSRSCDWPAKSGRRSYSLKMFPQLGHAAWIRFFRNLPRQGMTVAGVCYPLLTSEQITSANDGFYWPTPAAQTAGEGPLLETLQSKTGGALNPNERAYNPKTGKHVQMTLNRAVRLWPTPYANCHTGPGLKGTGGPNLQTAVEKSPTPSARDWKGTCNQPSSLPNFVESRPAGGRLNPTWVEWLMGYRPEWTVLEDSVMQWFQSKRGKRSKA